MKKVFLFACLSLYLNNSLLAAQFEVRPYNIGDYLPKGLTLRNVVNYKTDSLNLNDFKGKIIILDFWATWCGPCISLIKRADSLQRQLGDKVQFVLVSNEAKSIVTNFYMRRTREYKSIEPSITEDTILNNMFQHTYIPHYVWINQSGKIVAITDGYSLTYQNISHVILQQDASFPLKRDFLKDFDYHNGLFIETNPIRLDDSISLDKVSLGDRDYHTVFTGYIDGMLSYSNQENNRISISNSLIGNIYQLALGKYQMNMLWPNRLIVEVNDTIVKDRILGKLPGKEIGSEFMDPDVQKWQKDNSFCFEIVVPTKVTNRKFEMMTEELNKYFGVLYSIKGVLENRDVDCLVLKRTSGYSKFAFNGENPELIVNAFELKINGHHFTTFVNLLAKEYQTYLPIVDETKYNDKIDLDLNCELSNLNALNIALQKYDLILSIEKRVIPMEVIEDLK